MWSQTPQDLNFGPALKLPSEITSRLPGGSLTVNRQSGLPPASSDYEFAARHDLGELRVVTQTGTWVVRPPAAGWPGTTAEERLAWIRAHLARAGETPDELVLDLRDAGLTVQMVDHGEAPHDVKTAVLSAESFNPDEARNQKGRWSKVLQFSGPAQHRMEIEPAKERIKAGFTVASDSGNTVKFGTILQNHFNRDKDTQRPRFLAAAEQAALHPVEVWQKDLRRNYIGRFQKKDGHFEMIVVTARVGEKTDEVLTFFPKKGAAVEKYRKGKKIYEK